MYNLHLSPEQIEIRDTVRDFVAAELKPVAQKPQRMEAVDHRPLTAVLAKASQIGLRTLALPEDLGGAGADRLTSVIAAEELAAGCPDTAAILTETSLLSRVLLGWIMTPAQRDSLLTAFVGDDQFHLAWGASLADTEIGVNYHRPHDSRRMTLTAKRDGTDYVLNGTSLGVANAPLARLIAIDATTDPTAPGIAGVISMFVARNTQGLTITDLVAGKFHGSRGDITFKNVRVPATSLLGSDSNARKILASARATPTDAAINLGIGRAAYEEALDYSRLRVQGGHPIIEHQAIAEKLADAAISIEVARTAIWNAAWVLDHPDAVADRSQSGLPTHLIAAAFTREAIYRATKDCAECWGAMSVMRDMPAHKHIKDARVSLHADAGVADLKLAIAEALL